MSRYAIDRAQPVQREHVDRSQSQQAQHDGGEATAERRLGLFCVFHRKQDNTTLDKMQYPVLHYRMANPTRSFRLSETGKAIMSALSVRWSINGTAVLETLLRQAAKKERLEITKENTNEKRTV